MNQIQIQEKTIGEIMLAKAEVIAVTAKSIRRIERNVWTVKSQTIESSFYVVTFDTALDAFMCTCKAFEFSTGICEHILATAFYEGGGIGGGEQ